MPKKPSLSETREATKSLNGSQFVNYDLTAEDKAVFKKWAHEHVSEVWDMADKLLDCGYQISVKWDSYNECYGCFLICKEPSDPNYGYILTGRGKTVQASVLGAFFRHYVIFETSWDTDGYRRSGTDDE